MRSLFPIALLATLPLVSCGSSSSAPTVTSSEVHVSTSQMDVTFERDETFTETYMVFGGMASDRDDMISKATVVGLSMTDARPIFRKYPDFHTCKSKGALMAQRATLQMDIVPASPEVLEELKRTLTNHVDSIKQGGDRVCVKLTGEVLKFVSASVQDQDITAELPPQIKKDYYLVKSAEIVETKAALTL
jgi:hypothetical protein